MTQVTESPDAVRRDRPSTSLARHSILYAGEWQNSSFEHQKMFLIEGGRVAWTYELPRHGEFGDISMLPNKNVLFAWYGGASEVSRSGEEVWTFLAPPDSEIHTCQPLDGDRVFLMLNAVPARALIVDRATGEIESDVVIPTGGTEPHGMFRHCRLSSASTVLVAHMDLNRVAEYDLQGRELWRSEARTPWAVAELANGNLLVSGDSSGYVMELNRAGESVWTYDRARAAEDGIAISNVQQAARLPNGNTVIANWTGNAGVEHRAAGTPQLLEISPQGDIVWLLDAWDHPALGVASNFQILGPERFERGPMFQR